MVDRKVFYQITQDATHAPMQGDACLTQIIGGNGPRGGERSEAGRFRSSAMIFNTAIL